MEELEKYLKTLVMLQLQDLPEGVDRPELLLSKAGFTATEIGELLGKSKAAAAKAVTRAKRTERGGGR